MRLLLLASMFVSFAFSAEAQMGRRPASYGGSYQHEIMTNLSNGIFQSGKQCDGEDCDSGTSLDIGLSYLRTWQDNFQIGGEGRITNLSEEFSLSGKSETLIQALAIGAYNFDSDFGNSFFAKAGLGLYPVLEIDNTGRDYETQLGFFLGVGKRFTWLSNIAYAPEIRLVKRGDIDLAIDIHILNFSITW